MCFESFVYLDILIPIDSPRTFQQSANQEYVPANLRLARDLY